ncbi:MAG TPA: metallophosphoesterase family protein [Dictyobacter sp.]|jgi:putative phosphoesterase|nr:metallophosphoesterase family protein [Dictyobacter sp.]
MRVAILSDIHGNQIALEAVLKDLSRQPAVDTVVIAGDLCLNGPRPREVLQIIQQLNYSVIQGNVDTDIVEQPSTNGAKKQSVIAWTRKQIGQQGIDYLANLPFSHTITNPNGSDLLVVHANPLDQEEAIFENTPDSELEYFFQDLPSNISAVAYGHYHVPYMRHWRHLLLVDAGSVGLSRDGDTQSAYAILNWQDHTWQVEHRRVAYDVEAVVNQLRKSGIPAVEKRIRVLTEAHY